MNIQKKRPIGPNIVNTDTALSGVPTAGNENTLGIVRPFPHALTSKGRDKVLTRKRKRSKHPLRELRLRAGCTLEDLAAVTKLSPSYLSRLESGSRRLNADIIQRLSVALSCNPAELLPQNTFSVSSYGIGATATGATGNYAVDLPVYTLQGTEASNYGLLNTAYPEHWVARPADFSGVSNAFACIIKNTQWAPRYGEGDRLFIHPSAPLKPSCSVLLTTKEDRTFIAVLKSLEEKEGERVITIQTKYAPHPAEQTKELSFKQTELKAVYRITGSVEAA